MDGSVPILDRGAWGACCTHHRTPPSTFGNPVSCSLYRSKQFARGVNCSLAYTCSNKVPLPLVGRSGQVSSYFDRLTDRNWSKFRCGFYFVGSYYSNAIDVCVCVCVCVCQRRRDCEPHRDAP